MEYKIDLGKVIFDTIEEETIIINLINGHYYSLTDTGLVIWDIILQNKSFTGVLQSVARVYSGDRQKIATDTYQFMAQLEIEGLLERISDPKLEAIKQALANQYTGQTEAISAVLQKAILELESKGAITSESLLTADLPELDANLPEFTTPILHIYSDMQELLLLDPIHDVNNQGWPATN